jgi:hypothetical protein
MAMTAIDLWTDAAVRESSLRDFGPGGPDRSVLAP